jgi:hypothetical protein
LTLPPKFVQKSRDKPDEYRRPTRGEGTEMRSALAGTAAVLLLAWFAAHAAGQMPAPTGSAMLATTLVGLQVLKKDLNSTVALVDAESAARLDRLSTATDTTIKEVEAAIGDISRQVKFDEAKLYADVFALMSDVDAELGRTGYLAYAGVNATLANLAAAMQDFPSAKAPTSLFATYPLRLSATASDASVAFFGHFPDADASHEPTVTYRVDGLPESTAALRRSRDGSFAFQIPQPYLKDGKFIEMSLAVPERKSMLFYGTATFHARVYVEKREPLTLEIAINQENPKLWAVVSSSAEHVERADSADMFNVGTASAVQLFAKLINDDTTYRTDSATFLSMPFRLSTAGAPCWCGCGGSSAALTSWDANSVNWQISAPSCRAHFCAGHGHFFPQTQACSGGATHAEIYLKPIFRVKLRNQRDDVLIYAQHVRMPRHDAWQSETLPWQWDNVAITGTFKDGAESHECGMTIHKDVKTGSCDLFSASVVNDILNIESR